MTRRIDRFRLATILALGLAFGPGGMATPPAEGAQDGQDRQTREAWDAIFIGGRKVGHIHLQVEPVTAGDGRELLRVQVNMRLKIKRQDDETTMALRYGTIETYEGQVLRLDTRTLAGPNETRVFGDAKGNVMPLTLDAGGQQVRVEMPWGPDVRGPYGPELSLARNPMQPGDRREVKTFIPDLNQVGMTVLEARQTEPVELGGGATTPLLRVDSKVSGPDGKSLPGMDTSYWVDPGGQILKSRADGFGGIITYRTTKEGALAPGGAGFDINSATTIKSARRINNSENVRQATYLVQFTGDSPIEEIFPSDARQSIRRDRDGSTLLEVRLAGPNEGESGPSSVEAEYLAANPMINSEDSQVVALARRATANAGADPWSKAQAITRWVADNIRDKNFETTFATASDVARDLSGDCTEHSVLTAAMCRASGIPARVAVGLVYVDELGGFGFHMWNEVYVNNRWVAVDASFRQTEVDATHLKLNETSLEGVSPYAQFLDVVRVFNALSLDPIEVK